MAFPLQSRTVCVNKNGFIPIYGWLCFETRYFLHSIRSFAQICWQPLQASAIPIDTQQWQTKKRFRSILAPPIALNHPKGRTFGSRPSFASHPPGRSHSRHPHRTSQARPEAPTTGPAPRPSGCNCNLPPGLSSTPATLGLDKQSPQSPQRGRPLNHQPSRPKPSAWCWSTRQPHNNLFRLHNDLLGGHPTHSRRISQFGPPRCAAEAEWGHSRANRWRFFSVTHRAPRTEPLTNLDPANQAMMASQSGSFASRVIPYGLNTAYPSHLFRLLRLRRLRLPLPLAERSFRCRRILDPSWRPRSGVPRSHGCALERAAAPICREAGTRVTTNTLVIEFTSQRQPRWQQVHRGHSQRPSNLPRGPACYRHNTGVPFTSDGAPGRRAGQYTGAALAQAQQTKERRFPELLHSGRCRLVVLAVEVGGRFSHEAAKFLRTLAHARARSVPPALQQATVLALISRWSALLAHSAMYPFASSLLLHNPAGCPTDGEPPLVSELLTHHTPAPNPSRPATPIWLFLAS